MVKIITFILYVQDKYFKLHKLIRYLIVVNHHNNCDKHNI